MTLATPPRPRVVPELDSVVSFGLGQLEADALLVLDQRSAPGDVVALKGPATDELIAQLDVLPELFDSLEGEGIVPTRNGKAVVLSAPVSLEDAQPIGTLHILYRHSSGEPDWHVVEARALAVARQIGLVLATERVGPKRASKAKAEDWLVGLNALAGSPKAIERITTMITRGLRPRFGARATCVTVWDSERTVLRALPGAFGTSNKALMASISGPPTNCHSLASRVFVTGRPYMANQAENDPGLLQNYVDVFRLQRVLAVPLRVGTNRIGVLILVDKPAPFTVGDVRELGNIAPQIAVAVQLALAIEKIRRSQHMERILATAATDIAAGKPLTECLLPALRELGRVTESSMAVLSPLHVSPVIWRGRRVDAVLERRFLRGAQEMARRAVGAFPHGAGDPGWAAVYAPVMFSGERVASVALLRQNGVPFGKDEAEAITRLASLAALAWASERYQHQLAELALSQERARIADELHDHVAQILFAAQIGLDSLLEDAEGSVAVNRRLGEVGRLLTKGEAAIRDVINNFAADSRAELIRRLQLTVEAIQEEFQAFVHVDLPDEETVATVPRPIADCLVKVAHEAIVNAVKHAGPCRITLSVALHEGGQLSLSVMDDGLGRPGEGPYKSRHGLTSMARAVDDAGGSIVISAGSHGRGTCVTATFVLDEARAASRERDTAASGPQALAVPAA